MTIAVVSVANSLAKAAGWGFGGNACVDAVHPAEAAFLGIDGARAQQVIESAGRDFMAAVACFRLRPEGASVPRPFPRDLGDGAVVIVEGTEAPVRTWLVTMQAAGFEVHVEHAADCPAQARVRNARAVVLTNETAPAVDTMRKIHANEGSQRIRVLAFPEAPGQVPDGIPVLAYPYKPTALLEAVGRP